MNYTVITYLLYLLLTIGTTIWVAKSLFKNGQIFLNDIFNGNIGLSESVNNLLRTGFYLINLGYAIYTLKVYGSILDWRELLETLSVKFGIIILILGSMHLMNVFVFFKLRKRSMESAESQSHSKPNIKVIDPTTN